ncbi:hypothetical protein BJ912DRAFT_1043383 [Pholiota molesta]|nr:hypothetical protein BJ912DRAFT_1043383 [Pholiota molesta]
MPLSTPLVLYPHSDTRSHGNLSGRLRRTTDDGTADGKPVGTTGGRRCSGSRVSPAFRERAAALPPLATPLPLHPNCFRPFNSLCGRRGAVDTFNALTRRARTKPLHARPSARQGTNAPLATPGRLRPPIPSPLDASPADERILLCPHPIRVDDPPRCPHTTPMATHRPPCHPAAHEHPRPPVDQWRRRRPNDGGTKQPPVMPQRLTAATMTTHRAPVCTRACSWLDHENHDRQHSGEHSTDGFDCQHDCEDELGGR